MANSSWSRSEKASQGGDRLVDLLHEGGHVEPGVLNVVVGVGAVVGQALATHPGVAKFSFTGGTEAGRAVAAVTAPRFAEAGIEVGGKRGC